MRHTNDPGGLYRVLALVFAALLAVMFLFEFTKQLLIPGVSLWQSHGITIVFTSILAVVLVSFPLRSAYREQVKAREELRLRQTAEAHLRRSELRYRSFVESVEDSIYTVDRETRYLLMNTRHLERAGLSPQVYTGKKYADFHSPAEAIHFEKKVGGVLATKLPREDEYEKSGRYFLRKFYPVIDPETNEVVAVTIISSDITERRNDGKRIEAMNRKLNLLNDITHHDMLNQLSALHSLLGLTGEQITDPVTRTYLIRGDQVLDTIQAQIAFSRDYQTIGVESPQWQDLLCIIEQTRGQLKIGELVIDESCRGLEIYADTLLEKVFFNLMDNSVRHAKVPPVIRIAAEKRDEHFLLTVRG